MTQREKMLAREIRRAPPHVREAYRLMRRRGNGIVMAHMLAFQQCSVVVKNSNSMFNESQHDLMTRGMSEPIRNAYVGEAQRAGINTHGKTYFGQLGKPSDRAAWVSSADECVANLKKKGCSATGLLNVKSKPKEQAPPKEVKLASDLVEEMCQKHIATEPRTREKLKNGKLKKQELRERIIDRYGQK